MLSDANWKSAIRKRRVEQLLWPDLSFFTSQISLLVAGVLSPWPFATVCRSPKVKQDLEGGPCYECYGLH